MEEEDHEVVIVGAGIAGLATAVALKRVGVRALVLEKSEGLRATGAALTLQQNAWLALDALGVAHELTTIYAPLTGYLNFPTTFISDNTYMCVFIFISFEILHEIIRLCFQDIFTRFVHILVQSI